MTARVERFLDRLQEFARRVAALELPLNDIWMPTTLASGLWFSVREGLLGLVVAPIALWGRLNHWLPLHGALWFGKKTSVHPDEPAMRTIIIGVIFVLVAYLAIATVIGATLGVLWGLAYLVSLPFTASVDFWFADRIRRAVRRARGYRIFRSTPGLQVELIGEAAWLRAEASALDLQLRYPRQGAGGMIRPGPSATPFAAHQYADPSVA